MREKIRPETGQWDRARMLIPDPDPIPIVQMPTPASHHHSQ
jgi:hypothetical protein